MKVSTRTSEARFYDRVDASADDWETEAAHQQIAGKLRTIEKLLSNPSQCDGGSVANIVSESYEGQSIVPNHLGVAFDFGGTIVRRETTNEATPELIVGCSGFAQQLRRLGNDLGELGVPRAKFKVIRVAFSGDELTATALFQATASGDSGAKQINATWESRWSGNQFKLNRLQVSNFEAIDRLARGGPVFSDCTHSAMQGSLVYDQQLKHSLEFWRKRIPVGFGIGVVGWQGLTLCDVNGDGRDDVYVLQPGGLPNALLIQQPDGTVRDDAAAYGLDWLDPCRAALFVDFDNDGDQDVAIAMGLGLIVMENVKARFRLADSNSFVTRSDPASMCAADYDNDGDLDLFLCGYNSRENMTTDTQLGFPVPFHDANNGGANLLLRNDGELMFTDVTVESGLGVNGTRFSLAAAWEDFDNDGDQDLYIANDFGRNNLYRNVGGFFVDVAKEMGVEDISAGMSVSWGDYNNDGWMDLYVSNMFSAAGNRIAFQRRFKETADESTRSAMQRHARGNSLFENAGGTSFRDVSSSSGVTMGRWAWGSLFADLNNDGYEDLLVANGFVTGEDKDDL